MRFPFEDLEEHVGIGEVLHKLQVHSVSITHGMYTFRF